MPTCDCTYVPRKTQKSVVPSARVPLKIVSRHVQASRRIPNEHTGLVCARSDPWAPGDVCVQTAPWAPGDECVGTHQALLAETVAAMKQEIFSQLTDRLSALESDIRVEVEASKLANRYDASACESRIQSRVEAQVEAAIGKWEAALDEKLSKKTADTAAVPEFA